MKDIRKAQVKEYAITVTLPLWNMGIGLMFHSIEEVKNFFEFERKFTGGETHDDISMILQILEKAQKCEAKNLIKEVTGKRENGTVDLTFSFESLELLKKFEDSLIS